MELCTWIKTKLNNWKERRRKKTLRIIKQSLVFDSRYPKDQDYKLMATAIKIIAKEVGVPEGNKFDLETDADWLLLPDDFLVEMIKKICNQTPEEWIKARRERYRRDSDLMQL